MMRALLVDFELYTEGDPDFKRVLCNSMAENVVELQGAVKAMTDHCDDLEEFRKVVHKVMPTITMLNDPELASGIAEIKRQALGINEREQVAAGLLEITEEIIQSLRIAGK